MIFLIEGHLKLQFAQINLNSTTKHPALSASQESILKSRVLDIGELRTWRHLQPGGHAWTEEVVDPLILAAEENVSFLFQHEVSTAEESQC